MASSSAVAAPAIAAAPAASSSRSRKNVAPEALLSGLFQNFAAFQAQARDIQKHSKIGVDPGQALNLLAQYSCRFAEPLLAARKEIRENVILRGKSTESTRNMYDYLGINLAVWELMHELTLSTAISPVKLLQWYRRHWLEEDVRTWWQEGSKVAGESEALAPKSKLWEIAVRLALADQPTEVLALLKRAGSNTRNSQLERVCDFLQQVCTLESLGKARGTDRLNFLQDIGHIKDAARILLNESPKDHPSRAILEVYAGCSRAAYDQGEDIAAKYARTWLEDFIFSHAWVWPDLPRNELRDLLQVVAGRHEKEEIDTMDKIQYAVVAQDLPMLFSLTDSIPDMFPLYFITHFVDILFYAGRMPAAEGPAGVSHRDRYLIQYAKELSKHSNRAVRKMGLEYLKYGTEDPCFEALKEMLREFCASAETDEEMTEALEILHELDLLYSIGGEECLSRSNRLRSEGKMGGCLRWACQANLLVGGDRSKDYLISELLDDIASKEDEFNSLLAALTPLRTDEPLKKYPPQELEEMLAPITGARAAGVRSGRLYFLVQYARCRSLRLSAQPASVWAPELVELLVSGAAGPASLRRQILEEELLPVLEEGGSILATDEALNLMWYVQQVQTDPLARLRLTWPVERTHQVMGLCLSNSILQEKLPGSHKAATPPLPGLGDASKMFGPGLKA